MGEALPSRVLVRASMDDVPHLDERMKEEVLSRFPKHERDARRHGIPALGAGAIYTARREDLEVARFKPPPHWPQCFALDPGWNVTAVLWSTWDVDNDILYITGEYYRGRCEPHQHAHAIKMRGEWIPGVIDPAAHGSNQMDGRKFLEVYRDLGLDLTPADNAVESGILKVDDRQTSGRLKVMAGLTHYWKERAVYRREERPAGSGRFVIVKKDDHIMDTERYTCASGRAVARTRPFKTFSTPTRPVDPVAGY